jgi:hypothetical protein
MPVECDMNTSISILLTQGKGKATIPHPKAVKSHTVHLYTTYIMKLSS